MLDSISDCAVFRSGRSIYLDKRPIPTSDHKLQLPINRQRTHNRRLDRTHQIAPLTSILQHNSKRIITPSTLLPQRPSESSNARRLPKKQQRLIQSVRAEPVQHSLARHDFRGRPAAHPLGVVHVVVVLELGDFAQASEGDEALKCAEVGVVAAVLEDRQEFLGFLGSGDQGVRFGGGCCEGFLDND